MNKLIDLGYCMARLSINALLIVRPDCADDDGAYSPAASIEIFGHANLVALRDALNEIFKRSRSH